MWCIENPHPALRSAFSPALPRRRSESNSLELMLRKCEGVQIKQTMLGRIFNYGTVYVTTGEATNSFEYIQDPIVFSTKIHQMIDALKASE